MTRSAPLVLGIETSCDDTACAVLDGEGRVLSSVVSSQLAAHRPYGGVVPEIASREHLANRPLVSREALDRAGVEMGDLGVVAATTSTSWRETPARSRASPLTAGQLARCSREAISGTTPP